MAMTRNQATEQQRAAVAAPRNRRALGDIGNKVAALIIPQGKEINRPITRSFVAQLAKAQAQAQAPGPRPVKLPPSQNAAPKAVAKKPIQVSKPAQKQKEVIEISSGSKKTKAKKREVHSLTSVLSARSKAASGISQKPQRQIDEIDLADAHNQFAVVEYIDDLYKFYKEQEQEVLYRPVEYMTNQSEITPKMRAILADWMIEVHHKFELMPETLYLSISVIDRFLSSEFVPRRELQLVGIAAMLISCKYEEIWAPEVNDFIHISDNAYTREQILAKEKEILNKLGWYLTIPTPYMFLVRFIKVAKADKQLEHMIHFYAELGIMQYSTVKYPASLLSASAVYAARSTLKKTPLWTETLIRHTGYTEPHLQECVKIMARIHFEAPESKLKIAYKKYCQEQFGGVAKFQLSPNLMNLICGNSSGSSSGGNSSGSSA
ncbi:hypothetical protein LUZ60_017558 [Juncus effusus]|nr:hypothetical protein LUZ60_017558 [Juncus effusus]